MADIFLSYSNKDRAMAARVEQALSRAGYEVFWDQEVPVGMDWNSWIGGKLRASRVAIVLWSKASVESGNVVHEATIAKEARKLIPAVIEDLKADDFPMGFYTVQGADLRTYRGGDHPGMTKLLAAVASQLGAPPSAPSVTATSHAKERSRRPAPWAMAIGAGAALLAVGAVGYVYSGRGHGNDDVGSFPIDDIPPMAAALVGDWRFEGVACGEGPHIALEDKDQTLVVTTAGAPTYRHAISGEATRYEKDWGVSTVVVEPEDARGQEYLLTLKGSALTVKNKADGVASEWSKCP